MRNTVALVFLFALFGITPALKAQEATPDVRSFCRVRLRPIQRESENPGSPNLRECKRERRQRPIHL